MIGGNPNGHLHGTLNPIDGSITGTNISYIYPDMETCLLGQFKGGIMQDAQQSSILDLGCDENGLLFIKHYSPPDPKSPRFYYEAPSNISFGAGPPDTMDPYEKKWLELKRASTVEMRQGVFTRRDLEKGTLVSSYSGFVFSKRNGELGLYQKRCAMNSTKSDDERRKCKKYTLDIQARKSQINIPPEFDHPDNFISSLGPKVY